MHALSLHMLGMHGTVYSNFAINAADLLGWKDKVGALEPGHYADVIAVPGNPLDNVKILESVSFVMKGGEIVRNDSATK